MVSNRKSLIFHITSLACGALALFLAAGLGKAQPVWMLGQGVVVLSIMVSTAFVVGYLLLLTPINRADQMILLLIRVILVAALVSLPITLFFVVTDISVSRLVFLYELMLLFILLVANSFSKHRILLFIFNIAFLAATVTGTAILYNISVAPQLLPEIEFNDSVTYEFASYHDVKITDHVIFNRTERADGRSLDVIANGGSINVIDENNLLLVNGSGKLFIINIEDSSLNLQPLDIKVPINIDTYLEQGDEPTKFFRVTDTLLEPFEGTVRKLYAAHHYFDTDNNCISLRLSETLINIQTLTAQEWITRYTSVPCVKIKRLHNRTGGKLAFMQDGTILMSIGDHSYKVAKSAVDNKNHFGKLMQIDTTTWTAQVFSKGHRNPQGLLVEPDSILSTEHGPQGGDELNVIESGSDYGWPFASYGTRYGSKTAKYHAPGDHSKGRRPLYAWVPSIGISNLIRITGPAFPAWKGDLLVASLRAASLFRVRIREERVVTIEQIFLGERIRDLVEMPSGRIVLWNGLDTIQIIDPMTHVISECGSCHVLERLNRQAGAAPNLWDIVGRKVASIDGYAYSEGLQQFGGFWSPERLDDFIADPGRTVPGTSMQHEGIKDPEKRKEIIQYLQSQSKRKRNPQR